MTGHLDAVRSAVQDVVLRVGVDDAPDGAIDQAVWRALDELGFTTLTVPTDLGGSGGDICDAAAALGAAALANVPLGEALLLAGPLLSAAGLQWPGSVVTASTALGVRGDSGPERVLFGRVPRVPWLRHATWVVLLVHADGQPAVAILDTHCAGVTLEFGSNVAGEPRDDLVLNGVRPSAVACLPDGWDALRATQFGAVCRTNQMAGAAGHALLLTARHVAERVQFGRPLIKFQAVQQMLAGLAADVTTVQMAADTAAIAMRDRPSNADVTIAAAKAEASSLARRIAAVSHQLHGAIGFSREHALGACTRRLWSWREEFGNELVWQQRLADHVAESSGEIWSVVTNTTSTLTGASTPR
ncbi:MAG: acyl-CoA dehydrogenase [Mycobacterium sp.]|nr:acyl-CoA dehydrogenase [Mycobacterium sp.]